LRDSGEVGVFPELVEGPFFKFRERADFNFRAYASASAINARVLPTP
jgi:hypothetical protein